MIDILTHVYNLLTADERFSQKINSANIKFNRTPDAQNIQQPTIVIDDYDDPLPESHSDGDRIAYNYAFQIDVYVNVSKKYNARLLRNEISALISEILWNKDKIKLVSNLGNDFNPQFSLYRSTKRYEAIFYDQNY
ncbi:hypothetical protein C7J88_09695 [Staphylococcus muscae]|uniref:Putative bacteriophage protein n=1 Tax=Staphylococcus muscae TaxID=1294 RepID=A0A240BY62_9STAP|nr:hypothetical protein [Staphylococcus muscae]AVQ34421.1 hypothetical protein C7J88_09695 [Staphylococcus muscae]PNZ03546.1 hypothetical protein CD131_06025 [Staphylococcus muscae]GGA93221.1 hypothetical protein GCM10007183_16750 [Staphylococcus muscae]SNW00727.1 putative bacteriophage protein [Staphylococcus muscae]